MRCMHTLAQLRAGQLAGATRLDLSAGLTEFPREIFELADTLEVLNLSGNALSDLPDDLPRLHRLKVVFASGNRFTTLPDVLGQCPTLSMVGFKTNQIDQVPANSLPMSLRWLILTDNRIERLPDTLGQCTALEKLALAGNRLRALPDTMAACRNLALARLSANAFESFPDWLFTLPRLNWLALAGNPALPEPATATAPGSSVLSDIDWDALSLHEVLGQGASGVIHRADWRHGGRVQPVAVKLFKGEVTSDGWPHSEMAACLGAGRHPGLIPVLGRVLGHPAGTAGLVMELIDPAFAVLAAPPSLESCSRDVYAPDTEFSLVEALQIASQTASALAHLHARGVMHGDFYGHNLLWRRGHSVLLGDHGAATMFDPGDGVRAQAFQRLEVRAWACLLEELLQHLAPHDRALPSVAPLLALQQACAQPDTRLRPDWRAVMSTLAGLVQVQDK